MLEGKAVVRETDMAEEIQNRVMGLAYQALDLLEVSICQSIAHYINKSFRMLPTLLHMVQMIFDVIMANIQPSKQKFDEAYGPAWHCVVWKDFGSCISPLCGSFIFFHVEMEFLIFKDGNEFSNTKEESIGVLQKAMKIYS
ncbi:hypothetical protein CRYUN_Cryun08bG0159400 [Craigia yunnanensis]